MTISHYQTFPCSLWILLPQICTVYIVPTCGRYYRPLTHTATRKKSACNHDQYSAQIYCIPHPISALEHITTQAIYLSNKIPPNSWYNANTICMYIANGRKGTISELLYLYNSRLFVMSQSIYANLLPITVIAHAS